MQARLRDPSSPCYDGSNHRDRSLRSPATPGVPMSLPQSASAPSALRVRYDAAVPVLQLPDDLPYAQLRDVVKDHAAEIQGAVGGRTARIDLGVREVQLFDLRRLIHLLRDDLGVEVTGLYVGNEAIWRYAERELKLKLFPRAVEAPPAPEPAADVEPAAEQLPGADALRALLDPVVEPAPEPPPAIDFGPERRRDDAAKAEDDAPALFEPGTALRRPVPLPDLPKEEAEVDAEGGKRALTLRRTLRSGASIRYDGDVTVFGDVNAGAQIRAGGNIVVMGRLRGVVHAGANGDEDAFILAFDLAPTQLRIAKHIAIAPERAVVEDRFTPEIAQVQGGGIVIEPYQSGVRARARR